MLRGPKGHQIPIKDFRGRADDRVRTLPFSPWTARQGKKSDGSEDSAEAIIRNQ
jgi:hypothetical protein